MKFSKQLAYNSVAEWQLHYMDYARLKKVITALKRVHDALFAARNSRGGTAATASQSRVLATRPVTYGHAGASRVTGSIGPRPLPSPLRLDHVPFSHPAACTRKPTRVCTLTRA